tara:strand:- start:345 stop:500 length:156 start_codon:yes stop_codon:yes gene_type:complete
MISRLPVSYLEELALPTAKEISRSFLVFVISPTSGTSNDFMLEELEINQEF